MFLIVLIWGILCLSHDGVTKLRSYNYLLDDSCGLTGSDMDFNTISITKFMGIHFCVQGTKVYNVQKITPNITIKCSNTCADTDEYFRISGDVLDLCTKSIMVDNNEKNRMELLEKSREISIVGTIQIILNHMGFTGNLRENFAPFNCEPYDTIEEIIPRFFSDKTIEDISKAYKICNPVEMSNCSIKSRKNFYTGIIISIITLLAIAYFIRRCIARRRLKK